MLSVTDRIESRRWNLNTMDGSSSIPHTWDDSQAPSWHRFPKTCHALSSSVSRVVVPLCIEGDRIGRTVGRPALCGTCPTSRLLVNKLSQRFCGGNHSEYCQEHLPNQISNEGSTAYIHRVMALVFRATTFRPGTLGTCLVYRVGVVFPGFEHFFNVNTAASIQEGLLGCPCHVRATSLNIVTELPGVQGSRYGIR